MSEEYVTQSEYDTQLILLIISLCFHVFEAFVTSMKLRMKCRHCCSCTMRPKDSSPDSASTSSSSKTGPSPAKPTIGTPSPPYVISPPIPPAIDLVTIVVDKDQ